MRKHDFNAAGRVEISDLLEGRPISYVHGENKKSEKPVCSNRFFRRPFTEFLEHYESTDNKFGSPLPSLQQGAQAADSWLIKTLSQTANFSQTSNNATANLSPRNCIPDK